MSQHEIEACLQEMKKQISNAMEIVIDIEKPLSSGIKVQGYALCGQEKTSIKIINAKPFFAFTKNISCDSKWNRMQLKLDERNIFSFSTEYDEKLQHDVEERIK